MRLVEERDNQVPVRTLLASVFYKDGLDVMIPELVRLCPDVTIISTGGTHTHIGEILGDDAEGTLITIEDYTGNPEIAGGLVKTLGYEKSLGLLTNTHWKEHQQSLADKGVEPIDVVVGSFYPFLQTIADPTKRAEEARSNMDIGGTTAASEATKNKLRVACLSNPGLYGAFIRNLKENDGATDLGFRLDCAKEAYRALHMEYAARHIYWTGMTVDRLTEGMKVNPRAK